MKHILNKHGEKLDQHKDAVRDELYWERYEQSKLAAREAQRKAAKEREAAAAAVAAAQGGNEVAGAEAPDWQVGTLRPVQSPRHDTRAAQGRIVHLSGTVLPCTTLTAAAVLLQTAWLPALGSAGRLALKQLVMK